MGLDEPSIAALDARGSFAVRHFECCHAHGMAQHQNAERAGGICAGRVGERNEGDGRTDRGRQLAELELRLSKQIMELSQWVERLEEARGLVRP